MNYPCISGLESRYGRMKYFINKVAQIAKEEGLSLGGWEDAALSHDQEKGIPFPRQSFQNEYVHGCIPSRIRGLQLTVCPQP